MNTLGMNTPQFRSINGKTTTDEVCESNNCKQQPSQLPWYMYIIHSITLYIIHNMTLMLSAMPAKKAWPTKRKRICINIVCKIITHSYDMLFESRYRQLALISYFTLHCSIKAKWSIPMETYWTEQNLTDRNQKNFTNIKKERCMFVVGQPPNISES